MKIMSTRQTRGYQLLCVPAFCGLALVFLRFFVTAENDQKSPKPASPVDPIVGIVDAFKTYRVVALGEGDHGNEQKAR
jgi:hypothetical protein